MKWVGALLSALASIAGRFITGTAVGALIESIGYVNFYVLTTMGIFVLRAKRPNVERPYRAFGYPFIPALYILAAVAIMLVLLLYQTQTAGMGLAIVLLGLPVYWLWWWSRRATTVERMGE